MGGDEEYFGSPDRIALARRSTSLWLLLRANPSLPYSGLLVSLSHPAEDSVDILSALAIIQGAALSYFYPANAATSLFAQLEERGLATDRHEHFWGGESALAASQRAQRELALPSDLTM